MTSKGGKVFIAAAAEYPTRRAALEAAGAEVWVLPDAAVPGRVDLRELMRELAKREVNEVHVEAGPRLSGALFAAGLIDEMLFYYAPAFLVRGWGQRLCRFRPNRVRHTAGAFSRLTRSAATFEFF